MAGNSLASGILKAAALVAAAWLSSAAQAQTFTASIATNPPSGGTVSGAGTYTNEATVLIGCKANPGWYVKDIASTAPSEPQDSHGMVHVSPERRFDLDLILAEIRAEGTGVPFDPTTITEYNPELWVISDSLTTVTFAPLSPTFDSQPASGSFLTGSMVSLSGGASGRKTIHYQWRKDGANLLGRTNSTLTLTNAQALQSGTYALVASNSFGMATSAPAKVVVSGVIVSANGQPVLAPSVECEGYATINLQAVFPRIYYTLDGTEPSFLSERYDEPFEIYDPSVLRAVAYTANFSQSVTSAPVTIIVHPMFQLDVDGYGTVLLDPPGGTYRSNTLVTVTAISDTNWTFLGWRSGFIGTNPVQTVRMDGNRAAHALFGTSLGISTVGDGAAYANPSLAVYPADATVWLTAVPGPGKYLKEWSWEDSSVTFAEYDPADIQITSPNMKVIALFAPIPPGKVYLTVKSEGGGLAYAWENLVTNGATCVVEAIPDSGQRFLGWSGDANGTNSYLSLLMNSNKTVTAHFTANAKLGIAASSEELMLSVSGYRSGYRIETSTNLSEWEPITTVTNFVNPTTFSLPVTNEPARMYRAVRP